MIARVILSAVFCKIQWFGMVNNILDLQRK